VLCTPKGPRRGCCSSGILACLFQRGRRATAARPVRGSGGGRGTSRVRIDAHVTARPVNAGSGRTREWVSPTTYHPHAGDCGGTNQMV